MLPTISNTNTETLSSRTNSSEESHSVHTDQGEEVFIEDLSQNFEQSLHLEDEPQSPSFDHHQPLPSITMSNQPAAKVSETCLGRPDNFNGHPLGLAEDFKPRQLPTWLMSSIKAIACQPKNIRISGHFSFLGGRLCKIRLAGPG